MELMPEKNEMVVVIYLSTITTKGVWVVGYKFMIVITISNTVRTLIRSLHVVASDSYLSHSISHCRYCG